MERIIVSSAMKIKMIRALRILCEKFEILCYSPQKLDEPLLSLAWIESLSFLDSITSCIKDLECSKTLMAMFGEVIRLALNDMYIFQLEIPRIARIAHEIRLFESITNL